MNKFSLFILIFVLYCLTVCSLFFLLKTAPIVVVGLLLLGLVQGFLLPFFLDVLIPSLVSGNAKPNTTFAKDVIKEGASNFASGNIYHEQQNGILRSYPLMLGYLIAAIVVVTSSNNIFGKGFMLGLGLALSLDLFLSREPQILRRRWFSVFQTRLSEQELSFFVWGVIGVFGILTVLVIGI